VAAGLELGEAALDVVGADAQVGVHEDPGGAGGGQHPGPHRGALAPVLRQPQHPGIPDPQAVEHGLRLLGGAVGAAVVHQDQLEVGPAQARGGERLQRRLDARRLLVHRDDQRPGEHRRRRG
jgi:hypothetical protein